MRPAFTFSNIIIFSLVISGCASQSKMTSETDDIYFSSKDRYASSDVNVNKVESVNGEDYGSSSNNATDNEYFSVGKEKSTEINKNSQSAYAQQQYKGSIDTQSASVVNNFYGNTNYYQNDNDYSYASQFSRFNNSNLGLSYSYYDPYFTSPYWNYGWSYYSYPYSGWSIGYNSWNGWNVGYSFGWGWPYYGYRYRNYPYSYWGCGYPYYGFGYGYGYGGYYNWGYPYYGYGYGGYYGSQYGYWNGYNDGYSYGKNSKPTITGRRNTLNQRTLGASVPPSRGNQSGDNKIANSQTNGTRNVIAQSNDPILNAPGANSNAERSVSDAVTKFDKSNSIYQIQNNVPSNENPRAKYAATAYESNSKSSYSRDKYEPGKLVSTSTGATPEGVDRSVVASNAYSQQQSVNSNTSYSGSSRVYNESRQNSTRPTSRTTVDKIQSNNRTNAATESYNQRNGYYRPNSGSTQQNQPLNSGRTYNGSYNAGQSRSTQEPNNSNRYQPQQNGSRTRVNPSTNSGTRTRSYTPTTSPRTQSPTRTSSPRPQSTSPSPSPSGGNRGGSSPMHQASPSRGRR